MKASQTRGKTSQGRLEALDDFVAHAFEELVKGDARGGLLVDLGVGGNPWTTLEWADAMAEIPAAGAVVGVDHHEARIEHARRLAEGAVDMRVGDFDLPLRAGEAVALLRVMNVLRQYPPAEVADIHARLVGQVAVGGCVLEGTCSPDGEVMGVLQLRRTDDGHRREGLWLRTDFSKGFSPWLFRDRLPRDLRREARPGGRAWPLFGPWLEAWEQERAAGGTPVEVFARTARRLAEVIDGVSTDPWLLERGMLWWRPEGGVG